MENCGILNPNVWDDPDWIVTVLVELSRLTTKPTKWHVRPAKIQINLGIRPVWSESSLSDAQADLSLRCPREERLVP